MAGNEHTAADIHASIVRLRREVEWYRFRLEEARDRLAALEQTAKAKAQPSEMTDKPASDNSHPL